MDSSEQTDYFGFRLNCGFIRGSQFSSLLTVNDFSPENLLVLHFLTNMLYKGFSYKKEHLNFKDI